MNYTPMHAANPGPFTGSGNWTYLIPGAAPVLIDAGVGHAAHLSALALAAPDGPAEVLVTHVHSDHSAGAAAIHARWPAARFSKHPWPERDAKIDVPWHTLTDGARVETAEGVIEVLHTPGHAPDHLAFWHADSRTLFAGDLLVSGGTVFIPASSGGNLVDYLQSLARLLDLRPLRALPAHGPAIDDPVALIHHYLDHRRRREEQIVTALESGLSTIDAVTEHIYTSLASAVVPMAKESVLSHLKKLEHEGRVCRDGQQWTTTDK